MKFLLLAFTLTLTLSVTTAKAEDVFRIEIGKDYAKYSDADMRRRVWELERAVAQLQARVFQLEFGNKGSQADSYICTVKAMGDVYTGTGGSKSVAKARAIEACKAARGDGFFCKEPKCDE